MRNKIFGIIASFALLSIVSCNKNVISGELIITNVNVIDIVNGISNSNQTVVVENGKITSITPFSSSDEINSESIINGNGKV